MQVKSRQPPPVANQAADRQAATQAASTGTAKILTYSPDNLDQDFAAAEAMLTGDFLTYYKFNSQLFHPRSKRATTRQASSVRASSH